MLALLALVAVFGATPVHASEAELKLPDLGSVSFLGVAGSTLLLFGLFVCLLGLLFGLVMYTQLKNLPVHQSMREISELIYETCKTYLLTQGKFILILWAFIGAIIVVYFGLLRHFAPPSGGADHRLQPDRHRRQLRRRLVRHPRSTPSPTRARPSPRCAASRSRPTPSRSRRA